MATKIHLPVKKTKNGSFMFERGRYRVHLGGHVEMGGFWIKQYADKLGKTGFMEDFYDILEAVEKDNEALSNRDKISIFNLYIEE